MLINDEYKTIASEARGMFRDRGSKFVAVALPVSSQEQIKIHLDFLRKKYHDATHHCYAWVLTPERKSWRVNDDGEPAGTAGKPILGQINSRELTNVLVVVIRYFGGTLLGVSGLINAYRSAADEALKNATIINQHIMETWDITFPYQAMNDVMKVLKDEGCIQGRHVYKDAECSSEISFRAAHSEKITGRLEKIKGVRLSWLRRS